MHSLSKRSNLAGVRVGFYAGDADLVGYLREVRKHVGMLVPGPGAGGGCGRARRRGRTSRVQRDRYRRRLERLAGDPRRVVGLDVPLPAGGFYLWFDAGDGWDFAERLWPRAGRWSAPATSTAPAVRRTFVPPWYNQTTASSSSPDDLECTDVVPTVPRVGGSSDRAERRGRRSPVAADRRGGRGLVVGVVAGIVLGARRVVDHRGQRQEPRPRRPRLCTTTLDFEETGTFLLFFERKGTIARARRLLRGPARTSIATMTRCPTRP